MVLYEKFTIVRVKVNLKPEIKNNKKNLVHDKNINNLIINIIC